MFLLINIQKYFFASISQFYGEETTPMRVFFLARTGAKRFGHRKRKNTEEKPKVVASVWREEFIQFLAALAIF